MTRKGQSGAALMEVLIALAITAMLAAALTQATRFGLTVIERTQAASAASTSALINRRRLAWMLSRIEMAQPDLPTAAATATDGFTWRGPGDEGGKTGIWRITSTDEALMLLMCDAFTIRATCEVAGQLGPSAKIALAGIDGEFREEWPPGPAPSVIRIGDQVIAPRLNGAVR